MRPELGPDDGPDGRYADLLGADADLAEIVGALDGFYGQGEPPARVATAIERAMATQALPSAAEIRPVELRDKRVKRDRWGAGLLSWGAAGSTGRTSTGMKGTATMTMTRKRLSTLAAVAAAVVVVGLMALLLRGFGPGSGVGSDGGPGIATAKATVFAHNGGIEVVAAVSCPDSAPNCDLTAARNHVVTILTQRLPALTNVPEFAVLLLGASDVIVDVAGAHPPSDILPMLDRGGFAVIDTGATQLTNGTDVSGQTCLTACQAGQYQVVFTNTDLDSSSIQVALDPLDGQPVITFALAGAARSRFAQYTGSHIGQYLTMTIDDRVVESAVIQSQIDGQGQLSGVGTAQQAHELAALMKYGALPASLTVLSTQTVAVGGQVQGGPFVCPTPSPFWQPCASPSTGGSICAMPTATPSPAGAGAPLPTPTEVPEAGGGSTCQTPAPGPTPTATVNGPPAPGPTPTPPATSTPGTPPPTPTPTATSAP